MTTADTIAAKGLAAGNAIWSAIEAAYDAGLNWKHARRNFDLAVEALCTDMPDDERPLFEANVFAAIPIAHLSAVERAEIKSNAWSAYVDFNAHDQRGEAA